MISRLLAVACLANCSSAFAAVERAPFEVAAPAPAAVPSLGLGRVPELGAPSEPAQTRTLELPIGFGGELGAAPIASASTLMSAKTLGDEVARAGSSGETAATAGAAAFDQAKAPVSEDAASSSETPADGAPAAPPSDPASATPPQPPAPPMPGRREFRRILASLYVHKPLSEEQIGQLGTLINAAVARKDLQLLTQMALLTSNKVVARYDGSVDTSFVRTRRMFEDAVYGMMLKYKLVDYSIGYAAERAYAAIYRHGFIPLEDQRDKNGRLTSGRRWLFLQVLARYLGEYLAS